MCEVGAWGVEVGEGEGGGGREGGKRRGGGCVCWAECGAGVDGERAVGAEEDEPVGRRGEGGHGGEHI